MALGTTFKQKCPSCEFMVPIREEKLIGKQVQCPQCKDKFVVQKPAPQQEKDEDAAPFQMKELDEKKPQVKTKKKKKPAKEAAAAMEKEAAGDEDIPEMDVEEAGPEEAGPEEGGAEAGAQEVDDAELQELIQKKGKKAAVEAAPPKKAVSKFSMGLALAVVGLVVLVAAAFFILSGRGTQTGGGPIVKSKFPGPFPEEDKKDKKEEKKVVPKRITEVVLPGAGAELTNLLPGNADHVAHVFLKQILDPVGPVRDAAFSEGLLDEKTLRQRLGFNLLSADDLLRADSFQGAGWSFTVLHLTETVDLKALTEAFGLEAQPKIRTYEYFKATSANPYFETLARFTIGIAGIRRSPARADSGRPLFIHLHNPQTLVFADETPMLAFLSSNKQVMHGAKPAPLPKKTPASAQSKDKKDAGAKGKSSMVEEDPGPSPLTFGRTDTYMTLHPDMKALLDRMESLKPDSDEKIWYSSATNMSAARLPTGKGQAHWQAGLLWDVSALLAERPVRLSMLGSGLVQKEARIFQLRQELATPQEADAKDVHKELFDHGAPALARFVEKLLGHKIQVPKEERPVEPNPANPMEKPPQLDPMGMTPAEKKDDEPTTSRVVLGLRGTNVDFTLDLLLDPASFTKLHSITSLMALSLKGEMELRDGPAARHLLAGAGKTLPEKGLSSQNIPPGQYPPGAFPRTGKSRLDRLPSQRLSWLAGLLPYLGQDALYGKINFSASWRHPSNWPAASTVVPAFLDPSYPDWSFFTNRPEIAFDLATTHYVGIAGVGLDAADYSPDDPAVVTKRGVLSYDNGAVLNEVKAGHGLSNTILAIQVPHDGLTGVNPWIAGGGSTLRGVPEKNSIAPFVLSKDKNGNVIEHNKKRGTFAVMTDGSVRFIDQGISDEVFQAMCTIQGPLPPNFDAKQKEFAPLLPGPSQGKKK